jgi:hypothetical protein
MNQRQSERIPVTLEVEVTHPNLGKFILHTRDVSDGGLFLRYGGNAVRPTVDMEVTVQLTQKLEGEPAPVVRGKVIRVTSEGFAVRYLDT